MRVDAEGWLVNEPGDVGRVVKLPRSSNYGALKTSTGKPIIFVHHSTATLAGEGVDTSDRDGTAGMAKRVASGSVKYYAHVYLGRDGVAYQMVPFTHAALSVEGSFKQAIPPEAKGKENNKIAASMEWTGWGGTKAQAGKDLSKRTDMRLVGQWYWQIPTLKQAQAAAEVVKAVVDWSGMNPEAAFYGHKEIGSGGHADPGPVIYGALDVIGRPAVGLTPRLVENLFPFVSTATRLLGKVPVLYRAKQFVVRRPFLTAGIGVGAIAGLVLIIRAVRRR